MDRQALVGPVVWRACPHSHTRAGLVEDHGMRMRAVIAAAARLDRAHRKVREALEFSQQRPAWLREFADVFDDARLTKEEFWVQYALHRQDALSAMLNVHGETDA